MKLWTGRLSGKMDALAAKLNNSLSFDQRLAHEDVEGSIAWAHALGNAGVITPQEMTDIAEGLQVISGELTSGSFQFFDSDEDIHTAVERRLTEITGATAGKLHTGRSRNDQVATDFCLWIQSAGKRLSKFVLELQSTLIARAETDYGIILSGYTHYQQAQPVLLSHWWLSHFWALERDRQRLRQVVSAAQILPLGSGALAGTTINIDRFALAEELGFSMPSPNSLDGVANRDFAAEFLFAASLIGVHLSRLAEALILYSTTEFGYVTLADEFSTGSSLMPQKKNPDPLELTRAASATLTGQLMTLLTTLKALPSAYDKDLQGDKIPVFAAADLLELLLPVTAGVITTLVVHPERMRQAINPQVLATDLADYLVGKGIPFREAHHLVGQAVHKADVLGIELVALPLEEWQSIHPSFGNDLYQIFDLDRSVAQRQAWGGTAPSAVKEQIEQAKKVTAR